MSVRRPSVPSPLAARASGALLLAASLCLAGAASAQEEGEEAGSSEDKVEEVIEERAQEEKEDAKPEDADTGEASYNVEDCTPAGEAEGEGEEMAEADGEKGEVAEAEAVEDCEQLVK